MDTILETIPHDQQRYPTVGDWLYKEIPVPEPSTPTKLRVIRSSQLPDPRMELLIQVHELVESTLCEQAGITQEQVDEFDKKFEADREAGLHGETDEPGDDKNAPYRVQHGIASGIERMMAALLGVDWNEYDAAVNALP